MGLRQWAGRHQLWQVNPQFHYREDQRDRGPIGSLGWFFGERGGEGPNIPEVLNKG